METRMYSQETGKSAPWTLELQQALDQITQLQRAEIPPADIPAVLSRLAAAQSALATAQGVLIMRIAAFSGERDGNGVESNGDRWLTSDEAASLLPVESQVALPTSAKSSLLPEAQPKEVVVLGSRSSPLDGDENTLKKEGS